MIPRYCCKTCGAESPTGIGYAFNIAGPMPKPGGDCPQRHVTCAAGVEYWPNERYPFRPVCTCGWSYGRGYVADHAARYLAQAHVAGERV